MTVKRAHMLTRSYLAGWANSQSQIFVMDAESRLAGVRSLSDATVVRYAYRTDIATVDLEAEYAHIESAAAPALKNLAMGGVLTTRGTEAVVRFLDMNLERGRWADQAAVRVPAAVATIDQPGSDVRLLQLGLGDRLALSRIEGLGPTTVTLASLGIAHWRWRVEAVESGLVTGDGAVLVARQRDGDPVTTICFPLSPTRMLTIGNELGRLAVPINVLIASQCRRWLIDQVNGDWSQGRFA